MEIRPRRPVDLIIRDKSGKLIAAVDDNRAFTLKQCQANAQLIAAAPDLLQALIDTRAYLMDVLVFAEHPEMIEQINNAIKKATSESI